MSEKVFRISIRISLKNIFRIEIHIQTFQNVFDLVFFFFLVVIFYMEQNNFCGNTLRTNTFYYVFIFII